MRFALPLILVNLAFATNITAENLYPDTGVEGMLGFAKKGVTTGGSDGPVVFINSTTDLRRYIKDAPPRTLVINKNLYSRDKIVLIMGSNKSIIGSWKSNVINNVYFHTSPRSSNIIFQNLFFLHDVENIENNDTQLVLDHGQRYWIDHCTFDGQKVDENDFGKLLKVARVDHVTISNCKFMNHEYGLILGFPSDDPAGVVENNNYPQLTIMFNYFDNINARAPGLMRYGKFHVFNNYINNCHLGFTIALGSKIYSEYNYFEDPKENFEVLDDKGDGFFKDNGSMGMPQDQISQSDTWQPSSEYSYKLKDSNYSREFCIKFSGAQNEQPLVFGGFSGELIY